MFSLIPSDANDANDPQGLMTQTNKKKKNKYLCYCKIALTVGWGFSYPLFSFVANLPFSQTMFITSPLGSVKYIHLGVVKLADF